MANPGYKMRKARKAKDMTLSDLANKTDLTSSLLSQVERGLADPSLSSLRKIATALDVPLAYFFIEGKDTEEIMHEADRSTLVSKQRSVSYEFLSNNKSSQLEFLHLRIQPGGYSASEFDTHTGEECIYVQKGTLTLSINDLEYQLKPGDSIHFKSETPHRWVNTGQDDAVVFSVVTPAKSWS
ncbi:MAG: helix-turn-helix transcriptional regulator [Anaerolineales bacterium]|nr:helix-turn-helix transcriptional regulator [Anaerolineales bacterium]